jgi:uncharacterized phage infection (PIP) family protein YhgE
MKNSTSYTNEQYRQLQESLQDMNAYLARVHSGVEQIVNELQTSNPDKALALLAQLMEGLIYCLQLIDAAATMTGKSLAALCVEGSSVAVLSEKVQAICAGIEQAAANKDYSLLGDVVEYDLADTVVQVHVLLNSFMEKAAKGTDA